VSGGADPTATDRASSLFADERPRLLGLAYRMTGSYSDAEDVVQDTWLRWSTADQPRIENPAAWLTTVATRLSLDRIRATERRRADYVGEWLPEPVATSRGPEETAELAESLTLGFLVLLDRLTPVERAVFLLADVFREPFAAISETIDKSEVACRQIASRARRKVHEERTGAPPDDDPELLGRLIGAVLAGDGDQLLGLLDPDVVLVSDGGPDRHAARRPVVGADRVTRLVLNIARRGSAGGDAAVVEVNGRPSLVLDPPEGRMVAQIDQRAGRVTAIWIVLNPAKLHGLDDVAPLR
jgi:RNA polymerase sigma-70 factor (ECF subfamily)